MINFFHTLCVCILALFGWYQPMESSVQPLDAQNKNAVIYRDDGSYLFTIADLLQEDRFIKTREYLNNTLGIETDTPIEFFGNSYNTYSFVNLSYYARFQHEPPPNASSYIYKIVVTYTVQPPSAGLSTMHKYQFDYYFNSGADQNPLQLRLSYIVGFIGDSSTAYYRPQRDNYNKFFFASINSQTLVTGNENIYKYGFYCMADSSFLPVIRDYYIATTQEDLSQAYENGYNVGQQEGYDNGLINGQTQGYNTGYNDGFSAGESTGYQTGYTAGLSDGQQYDDTALTIFTGIIEVGLLPVNIFLQMFNYEIFGINISGVVSALLTISIVIIIVRFLLGKKDD